MNNNFFIFEYGKNSAFRKIKLNEDIYLEKYFSYDTEEERIDKIKITEEIIKYSNNNYLLPIDTIYTDNIPCGYLIKYLENSLNFAENTKHIPYNLRLNACLNTSIELQYLHNLGFIFNDIKLSNQLLTLDGLGFLIDFEDMILINDYKIKASTYRFFIEDSYNIYKPSIYEDLKKQFICNLSILLQIDLENFVIRFDEWNLLEHFKIDKTLYLITKAIFKNNLIYFHDLKQYFSDEEKINSLKKQINI